MAPRQSLISVVIPSYNNAHLIGRALRSVLEQSLSPLEVIVVDNHSSDGTAEVVASFADDRVRFLQVNNGGVIAISRNHGIRAARGDWIAFLDSDDWWTVDKLARCAEHFTKADLIYHRLRIVNEKPRLSLTRYIGSWQVRPPVLEHMLCDGNPIATSSVVVRRSLLERTGGFDERREVNAAHDFDGWLRVAALTDRFHFVRACLGCYLFSMNSVSRIDMSIPMRYVFSAHSHQLTVAARSRMEANAAYAAGRHAWHKGDLTSAQKELLKAMRYGRFELRVKSLLTLVLLELRRLGGMVGDKSGS
jgi:glycosyltransferase involved in cell wall biosynthesis